MKLLTKIITALFTLIAASSLNAAMVTINNHSFENGANIPAVGDWNNNDPEDWIVDESGGQIGMQADTVPDPNIDGAVFSFVQGDTSSLIQEILTGPGSSVATGGVFTLTVAAVNQNASPSFDFDIQDFGGNSLIGGPVNTAVAGGWTDYVAMGTVDTAGGTVQLVLNSNGPQIRLDNVRLDYVAPVPEPSSTALLGLGGLALILRRKK